jgi:hypothetical protein
VCELNSRERALRVDEVIDATKSIDVRIIPNAEIVRRDTPFGGDGGCLCKNERRATDRKGAQMHEVPLVAKTVDARILTHRRYNHAIAQR